MKKDDIFLISSASILGALAIWAISTLIWPNLKFEKFALIVGLISFGMAILKIKFGKGDDFGQLELFCLWDSSCFFYKLLG